MIAAAEHKKESIHARYEALQRAYRKPELAPPELLTACENQSALAALELPELGITSFSRNTMYKYADLVLAHLKVPEGDNKDKTGQHYLDWLRNAVKKKAKEAGLRRTQNAMAVRKSHRKKEKQAKQKKLEAHVLKCNAAYTRLFASVLMLCRDNNIDPMTRKKLANLINQHQVMFHDLLDEGVPEYREIPDNVELL